MFSRESRGSVGDGVEHARADESRGSVGDGVEHARANEYCPCGSAAAYDACCGPLHRGTARATSPEQLMRSRFAAYAVGETDYVFRTWHPRTRPDDLTPDPSLTWTRLEVLDATGEEVEFIAHFDSPAGPGSLHERSVFEQRGGRWVYVAAVGR